MSEFVINSLGFSTTNIASDGRSHVVSSEVLMADCATCLSS